MNSMGPRYRRTLLGTVGTTLALGAGCLSNGDEEDESTPEDGETEPDSKDGESESDDDRPDDDESDERADIPDDPLAFLPASVASEPMAVAVTSPRPLLEADVDEADDVPYANLEEHGIDPNSIDREVVVSQYLDEMDPTLAVLTGDATVEGEGARRDHNGVEFTLYERRESVAAVCGEVVIVADAVRVVTNAIDAARGDTTRLLEHVPRLEEGLAAVDDGHLAFVAIENEFQLPSHDVEQDDVRYLAYGTTVSDGETQESSLVIGFTDADLVTDELVRTLEESFRQQNETFRDDPSGTVDGAVVEITYVEVVGDDPDGSEHLDGLNLEDFEPDDEYAAVELRRGDPTPVEDVQLELDCEPYDREIWAGDAETLAAGDTVRIRTDDLEPKIEVTLRVETDHGTVSTSTTLLEYVSFEITRELESGDVTVAYPGPLSLSGDDVTIALLNRPLDRETIDPERTVEPWAGGDVEPGDVATVEDVEPGTVVAVGWQGTSVDDILDVYYTTPPGRASFERDGDANRVSVILEFPYHAYESRPAAEYRIRVDAEPAESQWTDRRETIESGDSVTLEDVGTDATVDVVYVGWEEETLVGSTNDGTDRSR